jgi:hypothetical protein
VKANQNTLHRQIRSQFQATRKIPFVETDHEVGHGPEITWRLRAREDPEHIRAAWSGTSRFVEVVSEGTRKKQALPNHSPILIHLAHLSMRHQPAEHDRSPAANGAGPLEYRGLTLDPRYPAPGRCPSHPGQRCHCTGQFPDGSPEPAAVRTVSNEPCGAAGGVSRHHGAAGDGKAPARGQALLTL